MDAREARIRQLIDIIFTTESRDRKHSDAFRELVKNIEGMLYAMINRANIRDRDEIYQRCLIRIYEQGSDFRRYDSKVKFSSYIYTVIFRAVIDQYREENDEREQNWEQANFDEIADPRSLVIQ